MIPATALRRRCWRHSSPHLSSRKCIRRPKKADALCHDPPSTVQIFRNDADLLYVASPCRKHAALVHESLEKTASSFPRLKASSASNVGAIRNWSLAMSIIPLHLQRRFEQRWAARVGSLVGPSALKNTKSKGSPINVAPRATRAKERSATRATGKENADQLHAPNPGGRSFAS